MTIEDQVRGAKTPGEALLILARALDMLRNTRPPSDDWTIPPAHAPISAAEDEDREWDAHAARVHYDREVAALGECPADAEDAAAWQARRSLLKDLLKAPTANVGVERSLIRTEEVSTGNFTITVPSATPMRRRERQAMAVTIGLNTENWTTKPELALDPMTSVEAYMKGGPLWLVAYDRRFVLQLPLDQRRAMVNDVEAISPDDAQMLGRDILKVTDDQPGGNHAAIDGQAYAQKIAAPGV